MAMLQFGAAMSNAVARFAPRTIRRINSQQLLALSSSAAANPEIAPISEKSQNVLPQKNISIAKQSQKKAANINKLVEAAFASILNNKEAPSQAPTPNMPLTKAFFTAKSVNELLTIATNCEVSRRNTLHIISILSDWILKKKTSLSEFDKDPRFLKLCQQLAGTTGASMRYEHHAHGDLIAILGLTGDDEAAKFISTLSLDQMIEVIQSLAHKRRRSPTILRSLSFNITRSMRKLDIKQVADLLYSMAILHFPDEMLLEKAIADLLECIPKNQGTAVIGSILTSLGFLRYKNTELLDSLCEWTIAEKRALRPQYITSLLLTLATVGHIPANKSALYKALIEPLKETDLSASEVWLDVVWATVVLGLTNPVHISSILDLVFIQRLTDLKCLTIPRQVKLLNINAAAKLIVPNYNGPFVAEDFDLDTAIMERSKQKQIYVSSVLETLSNLFPSVKCSRSYINTGMGFVLDAECYLDDKCNPLPIDQVAEKHETAIRIGIIALCYDDFCRGKNEPLGIYSLMRQLLETQGYKIVMVPYTEYDAKDKLVTRVKYIEQKIKSLIIKPPPTYSSN